MREMNLEANKNLPKHMCTFLYFDVEGAQVTARVDPSTPLKMGSDATFALDMTKIHLFDKETEKNILFAE